jgi:hypothetical protein
MAKKHRPAGTSSISASALGASRDQSKPPQREQTKSADFFSVYTNDITLQTSAWDLRMVLGEVGDISADEPAVIRIKSLGEVHMSPQLAKRLVRILVEQLKAYEGQFGEIPNPKD